MRSVLVSGRARRVGLALLVLVVAAAIPIVLRSATVVGTNVNASNLFYIQNETAIAIDPTNTNHLVGASADYETGNIVVYESVNGGTSWTTTQLPFPGTFTNPARYPSVAFNSLGDAFLTYTGTAPTLIDYTIVISKKLAGGSTWGAPVTIPNTNGQYSSVAVDRGVSSNPVYVGWASPVPSAGYEIRLSKSTDGGASFTSVAVSDPDVYGEYPSTAVGPNGEVYVAFRVFGPESLSIDRSTDGGITWGTDHLVHTLSAPNGLFGADASPKTAAIPLQNYYIRPFIDVDRSNGPYRGTVYCVFNDKNASNRLDILLRKSTDGGTTWSPAVRVNDDAAGLTRDQFLPSIAVDEFDGSVNISWDDTRNDANNKKTDIYYARSTDGGATFSPNIKVTTATTDESVSAAFANAYGETTGIAVAHGVAHPMWTDRRTGVPSGFEEIYTATITTSDFSLTSIPTSQVIAAPASTSTSYAIGTSALNFAGTINLTVTGVPTGASASFSPASVAAGSGSTLSVDRGTAAPGVYALTITGTSGATVHTLPVTLTITIPADLTIAKSHSGSFTQGQTGATYTLTVTNGGTAATAGTVTAADTLPTGLTATAIAGTGWTCTLGTVSCTRNDALNPGASYPDITITVTVAGNAAASVTNTAQVSGGGESVTTNDTASDPTTILPGVAVTVNSSQSGRTFTVDGTGYTTSQAFTWPAGSVHTIATTTPQAINGTSQAAFTSWSDGGALSHSVTVPATATTYTASFVTQFKLTISASPTAGGTVSPASGTFYNTGTLAPIVATPNPGYQFVNWTPSTGIASTTSASTTVNMTAARTVTANFQQVSSITVTTSPAGRSFTVDGVTYTSSQTFTWVVGTAHTIATTTPQTVGSTRYVWANWSDSGALSHSVTTPASATTYTANFTTQYQLTTAASPIAGGTATPASGAFYDTGTVVNVGATPTAGYQFNSWTGSVASTNSAATTVTMTAPTSVTANFDQTVSVTVTTFPAGRSFTVDGTPYSSSQNLTWVVGSAHAIATTTPQAGAAGTQYAFANWSDAGALSHSVTAPGSGTTYTANFTTQYQLTTAAVAGGTATPASGAFYDTGTVVNVGATPNAGYQFSSWTGSVASTNSAATTVTMTAPTSVTANFDQTVSVTVTTFPAGRSFSVDGTPYASSQTFSWVVGSAHTVATTTPQAGGAGTQYAFASWSDGGGLSHSVTTPASATTYTANFTTQYQLTTAAAPGAGGTASPASGTFYNAGSVVPIGATPNAGYQFGGWTGSVAAPASASTTVTMSAPQSVTANFQQVTSVTVVTSPAGRTFMVDGTPYSGSQTFTWLVGSPHTVTTTNPQPGTGMQYAFNNWSDGGAIAHALTVPSTPTTYTASFDTVLPATDVSGTVTITRGGFKLVQATGRFTQAVVLKNTGTAALSAVSLVFDNLTPTVLLFGESGKTSCALPSGSSHAAVNVGADNLLTPGEQVTMTLEFTNPAKIGITYGTRVLAGAGCR